MKSINAEIRMSVVRVLSVFLAFGLFAGLGALSAQEKTPSTQKVTQYGHKLGEAEDLSGVITSVDTATSTLTVTAQGIPYVFHVTAKTKIVIAGKKADVSALSGQTGRNVSVHFLPFSNGNVAENVTVS